MDVASIIAELEGAATWEAMGISALETTRFEPELDARAQEAIAASRRRVSALSEAVRMLRQPTPQPRFRLAALKAWMLGTGPSMTGVTR